VRGTLVVRGGDAVGVRHTVRRRFSLRVVRDP
jgi:hypothetical protein